MKFSPIEKRILINLWTNDTKNMASALSEMIRKDVKIVSCSLRRIWVNMVPKFLNPQEVSFLMVYTKILRNLNGVIAFTSSLKNILKIIDILLHKKIGYYNALSQENLPVIKELGNVLNGYYLTSLSNIFGNEISWEYPRISTNAYRVIEDFEFNHIYIQKIYVLMFNGKLSIDYAKIRFQMLLLLKEESARKLLDKLAEIDGSIKP